MGRGRSGLVRPRLVRALANPVVTGSLIHTLPPLGASATGAFSAGGGGSWASNILALGLTTLYDEIDFSQTVPGGGGEQSIAGKSPWTTVGAAPNITRVTDASDPKSPSSVWQVLRPAGVYDSGVEGQGSSSSFGHVGRPFSPNLTEIGVCLSLYLSPAYHFHSVSEKLIFLQQNSGNFILQVTHNADYLRASDEAIGEPYDPQTNTPIPRGQYNQIELYVKQGNPGIVRVWLNGALKTNYTTSPVLTAGSVTDISLNSTAGGGGMTLTADDWRRYGHLSIYTR